MPRPDRYAVIQTGGKQYVVYKGRQLEVEKLAGKSRVVFDQVLLAVNEEEVVMGEPFIKGAKVKAKIVERFRAPKIKGFKFDKKMKYGKRYGHRQEMTRVEIEQIDLGALED
ncbi:50S ribosomal protein L21 [candidate division CPR3 bacterium 4484_211]|uniref:Large ribosomal subunit protein bL21 n=1 Tax=candidate division CPR3 bacterium 4484_211 TaxID=1968527 RepID=A0A1W9NYR2_UNCC3|nr:MAG: 50S ribosomal protein L21 [candidate division CPR3 bacterium 4484_211]